MLGEPAQVPSSIVHLSSHIHVKYAHCIFEVLLFHCVRVLYFALPVQLPASMLDEPPPVRYRSPSRRQGVVVSRLEQ